MKRYLGLLVGIAALGMGIPTASAAGVGHHRRHHHKVVHHLVHHRHHHKHHHHHA